MAGQWIAYSPKLNLVLQAFTPEQREQLADAILDVLKIGYGEVEIIIRRSKPRFIGVKQVTELKRPDKEAQG